MNLGNTIIQARNIADTLGAGEPQESWFVTRYLYVYTPAVRLLPRCTVGSRQAEHESHRESMEEDDMVMKVGMAIPRTETNR